MIWHESQTSVPNHLHDGKKRRRTEYGRAKITTKNATKSTNGREYTIEIWAQTNKQTNDQKNVNIVREREKQKRNYFAEWFPCLRATWVACCISFFFGAFSIQNN